MPATYVVYIATLLEQETKKFNVESTLAAIDSIMERYPITHISFFANGEPLLYFDALKKS